MTWLRNDANHQHESDRQGQHAWIDRDRFGVVLDLM